MMITLLMKPMTFHTCIYCLMKLQDFHRVVGLAYHSKFCDVCLSFVWLAGVVNEHQTVIMIFRTTKAIVLQI